MIFRTVFWFSLVVMLMPVKNDLLNARDEGVTGKQALVFVQSLAGDITGFCTRNPDSCVVATQLAQQYAQRVKAHAANVGGMLVQEDKSKRDEQLTTVALTR